MTNLSFKWVTYRGPILRVTSQALGSDDSTLDQSATSIQILLRSRDTLLIKLRLYKETPRDIYKNKSANTYKILMPSAFSKLKKECHVVKKDQVFVKLQIVTCAL